ncbi:MAG: hypothetical protein JWO03_3901 [Bacteroidetes bacterium]|nr:hypothetical protein [Bacteroidota bacterium]
MNPLAYIISLLIGWPYMKLRYRNKIERDRVLREDFDGRYANAGFDVLVRFIFLIMIVGVSCLIFVTLYRVFIKGDK